MRDANKRCRPCEQNLLTPPPLNAEKHTRAPLAHGLLYGLGMKTSMRTLWLALGITLLAGHAVADGRLTRKTYGSAEAAAKAQAAYRMNRVSWLPYNYGPLRARDMKIARTLPPTKTTTRYRVFFDNHGGSEVARVDVSVKQIGPNAFKAFRGTTGASVRGTPPGH